MQFCKCLPCVLSLYYYNTENTVLVIVRVIIIKMIITTFTIHMNTLYYTNNAMSTKQFQVNTKSQKMSTINYCVYSTCSLLKIKTTFTYQLKVGKDLNPFVTIIADINATIRADSYTTRITKLTISSSIGAKAMNAVMIFIKD